jgi:hypothetical protein
MRGSQVAVSPPGLPPLPVSNVSAGCRQATCPHVGGTLHRRVLALSQSRGGEVVMITHEREEASHPLQCSSTRLSSQSVDWKF